MHMCVRVHLFMSVTLNRDYLPSEKAIGYVQNEVLKDVEFIWRSELHEVAVLCKSVLSACSNLGLQCPAQAVA